MGACEPLAKLLIEAEQLQQKLRGILPSNVSRENVSMVSKSTLKAYLVRAGLLHRMADLAETTIDLYRQGTNLPAFVLTRAIFETFALFYYFWKELETAVSSENVQEADHLLMQLFLGARNSDDELNPIRVGQAIKRLNEDCAGVRVIYADLCEIAHPNWMGTVGHYGNSVESVFDVNFEPPYKNLPPETGLELISAILDALLEWNDPVQKTLSQFKSRHEQEYDTWLSRSKKL